MILFCVVFLIAVLCLVHVNKTKIKKIPKFQNMDLIDFSIELQDIIENQRPSFLASKNDFDLLKKCGIFQNKPIVKIDNINSEKYKIIQKFKKKHNFTAVAFSKIIFGDSCIFFDKSTISLDVFCAINKCSNTIKKNFFKLPVTNEVTNENKTYREMKNEYGEKFYFSPCLGKTYYFPKMTTKTELVFDCIISKHYYVLKNFDKGYIVEHQETGEKIYITSNKKLNLSFDDYCEKLLIIVPPNERCFVNISSKLQPVDKFQEFLNDFELSCEKFFSEVFFCKIHSENQMLENIANVMISRRIMEKLYGLNLFENYGILFDSYQNRIHKLFGVKLLLGGKGICFEKPSVVGDYSVEIKLFGKSYKIFCRNSNENKIVICGTSFYNLSYVSFEEIEKSNFEINFHF